MLEETFSVTEDRFGELVTVDLKPGGSNIPVTEENKREYVDLAVHYRIVGRIKEQFGAFIDGFFEVVTKSLIAVFDERELELLIGGMTDIDMCVHNRSTLSTFAQFFFLSLSGTIGPSLPITAGTIKKTKSSPGSGRSSVLGLQNRKLVFSSSPPEPPGYQSTVSRTFKALMAQGGSPLKNTETPASCHEATRALID